MLPQEYRERMNSGNFRFKDDAVVVSKKIIGVVQKISLGAVDFQYMDRGQNVYGSDLEIMAPCSRFLLMSGEYTIGSAKKSLGVGTSLTACRLLFSNLSDLKRKKLWKFIQENCIGFVSQKRESAPDFVQLQVKNTSTSRRLHPSSVHRKSLAGNSVQL